MKYYKMLLTASTLNMNPDLRTVQKDNTLRLLTFNEVSEDAVKRRMVHILPLAFFGRYRPFVFLQTG